MRLNHVGMTAGVVFTCAVLGMAVPANAATVEVGTLGNTFFPADVVINEGDSVHWSGLLGGFHTVAEVDNAASSIYNGGFHSAPGANEFTSVFNAAGVFHYVCEPHAPGMRGTVSVIVPVPTVPVPTVSEWSLIIMTVLAFTAGTILFSRRRRAAAA